MSKYKIEVPIYKDSKGNVLPEQSFEVVSLDVEDLDWKSKNYDEIIYGLGRFVRRVYEDVRIPRGMMDCTNKQTDYIINSNVRYNNHILELLKGNKDYE